MNTEKVAQRIKFFMDKKAISIADLAERTGLESGFIEAIQSKNSYPSLGAVAENCPRSGRAPGNLSGRSGQSGSAHRPKDGPEGRLGRVAVKGTIGLHEISLAWQGQERPPHGAFLHRNAAGVGRGASAFLS